MANQQEFKQFTPAKLPEIGETFVVQDPNGPHLVKITDVQVSPSHEGIAIHCKSITLSGDTTIEIYEDEKNG
jgi:hypothetical protein